MNPSEKDWLAEADAHYVAQRWSDAGTAYERALALDPRRAQAWYRLGNVREEEGRDADALACFEKAVALEPLHAQAWNNLGGARQRLGHLEEAVAAFRAAVRADPHLPQPYLNLGRLAEAHGERAEAAGWFRAGLAQHPRDATLQHLAAAASGVNTKSAPRDYVVNLFDAQAPQFERHLVEELDYRTPEGLARLIRPMLQAFSSPTRILDLGCGTGLVGAALAGPDVRLVGVDLSPRMLELAAARGIYAQLEQADVADFLDRQPAGSAQAIVAADVFIYIGDLDAIFVSATRTLSPGGVFAFSVEGLDEGTYRLQGSGRYAQSLAYLRELAAAYGMVERALERTRIRREKDAYAEGWLVVLGRSA
jgi:predicted TPR repeat methyltransferase